ncbi:MAG TPA: hypothetical protein VKG45_04785 [Actinomycetes bacterium]|nr:hypothetical protein [Actinomycetes bacterium]
MAALVLLGILLLLVALVGQGVAGARGLPAPAPAPGDRGVVRSPLLAATDPTPLQRLPATPVERLSGWQDAQRMLALLPEPSAVAAAGDGPGLASTAAAGPAGTVPAPSRPDVPGAAGLTVPQVWQMGVDLRGSLLLAQSSRPRSRGGRGGAKPGTPAQPGTGSGQPKAGQAPRLPLLLTDEEIDLFLRLSGRMGPVYESFKQRNAELQARLEGAKRDLERVEEFSGPDKATQRRRLDDYLRRAERLRRRPDKQDPESQRDIDKFIVDVKEEKLRVDAGTDAQSQERLQRRAERLRSQLEKIQPEVESLKREALRLPVRLGLDDRGIPRLPPEVVPELQVELDELALRAEALRHGYSRQEAETLRVRILMLQWKNYLRGGKSGQEEPSSGRLPGEGALTDPQGGTPGTVQVSAGGAATAPVAGRDGDTGAVPVAGADAEAGLNTAPGAAAKSGIQVAAANRGTPGPRLTATLWLEVDEPKVPVDAEPSQTLQTPQAPPLAAATTTMAPDPPPSEGRRGGPDALTPGPDDGFQGRSDPVPAATLTTPETPETPAAEEALETPDSDGGPGVVTSDLGGEAGFFTA